MVLAKGARRQKSGMRGVLMPFKPLLLSWSGKGQLPILIAAESQGFVGDLVGRQLHAGYYINELILKLLHRFDEHKDLYDAYDKTVRSMITNKDVNVQLRLFEKKLLQEIGFGIILDHDVESGKTIEETSSYRYLPQFGPVVAGDTNQAGLQISGKTLIAFKNEHLLSVESERQARLLTRNLIDQQLGGKELRSRRIMRQILRYQKKFDDR